MRPKLKLPAERNYTMSTAEVIKLAAVEFDSALALGTLCIWRKRGFGPSFIKPGFRCVLYDEHEVRKFLQDYFASKSPAKVA